MNRERVTLQPAFVLHQRPYRDSSRLIDCLSRDYGRIALVARGVRRPRSRLRSVLMPFQPVLLSWTRRGELGTLTGAEGQGPPAALSGTALMSAYYLNELLLRLVQSGDAQAEIYVEYADALLGLHDESRCEATLRRFEKRLLDALGYGLALDTESDGARAVRASDWYRYRAESGPVRVADGESAGRGAIRGETLLAMAREQFDAPETLAAARRLLGEALAAHLGDRPLRVRTVARAMARGSGR